MTAASRFVDRPDYHGLARIPRVCQSCQQLRWAVYVAFPGGRGFFCCAGCAEAAR